MKEPVRDKERDNMQESSEGVSDREGEGKHGHES